MHPSLPRWIAHLDVDAMFCQAAVHAWPDALAGVEYLIVGGHPDRRGVVTSATYPARRRGVHAGMAMKTALALCPQAVAAPVPWPVVKRTSRHLFSVLARFGERVERASIDEGYLLLPPGDEPPEGVAHRIRDAVLREVGVTTSLGVSTLRFTAKMATGRAKPSRGGSGVYIVPAGSEYDFVGEHPLGDIPHVGPAMVKELARRGVSSLESVRRLDLQTLVLWLGPARARFLHDRVRAVDPTPVGDGREARKSISAETTFETDLYHLADLERELASLVADVGRTLRREGLFARTLSVKLRGSDFRDRQRNRTLPQFVQTDGAILRNAAELFRELRQAQTGYVRLLGVTLSGLEGEGAVEQTTLDPIVRPLESDGERQAARRGTG